MTAPQDARNGKFNSARDELLYRLAVEGWANETSGDVQSRTGWFARISNAVDELGEIRSGFEDDIVHLGAAALAASEGHFLLVEDGQGFVDVTSYENYRDLIADYRIREEVYETEGRET